MSTTDSNLHWMLLRTSLKAKMHLAKIAEKHNLSVIQLYTLFFLEPGAQVPMNTISDLLSCDPSNVTTIVDRLLAASYITRQEKQSDRRVKVISLTTTGAEFRAQMLEQIKKDDVPSMSALSQSEAKTLERLLLKVLGE